MKIYILKTAMILMCVLSTSISYSKPIHVKLEFDLARPKNNCVSGIWFCNLKGGVGVASIYDKHIIADATYETTTGSLTLQFAGNLPMEIVNSKYFYAENGEEVMLPDDINRQIGQHVQIIPGKYKVNFTSNGASVTVATTLVN